MLSGIEGKRVKITGRIELYKDKPEIRVNAAEQVKLSERLATIVRTVRRFLS